MVGVLVIIRLMLDHGMCACMRICICAPGLLGSRVSSVKGLFRLEIAFSPSDFNKLLAPP